MQAALQVGPFILKTQWLVIILSAFVGYSVMRYRLKTAGYPNKRMIETIENSLIIALMVWKLSLILFDPVSVVTNPLGLLYFSGGERGIWLAAVVVIFYFYYRSKKDHVSVCFYGDLLAAGFLATTAVYHLIHLFGSKQPIWVDGSEILIALLLLLLIFRRSKGIGMPYHLNQVLMWFSLGQVFVLFLNPLKQNDWWGFSQGQILYLSLAALCLAIGLFAEKKRLIRLNRIN
ncbi:hypothetical protein [Desulfosporosinus sp.]|uniref:hypothetical protein n=1 Tax=Desulfosporosinus sp. TaxID=157907 RepID=UPI002325509A|nr:hypothetical protein [Desulfosporosinus sp.]MCO5387770.1 hypothetical protein [Desulfosporosinus sp.]MDA8224106.1 hypothetical protein [Desulfitobacterium hafniense]